MEGQLGISLSTSLLLGAVQLDCSEVGPRTAVSLQSLVLMCLLSLGPPSGCGHSQKPLGHCLRGNASVAICSRRAGWAPASTRPLSSCMHGTEMGDGFVFYFHRRLHRKQCTTLTEGGGMVSRGLCPEQALAEWRASGPGHTGKVIECQVDGRDISGRLLLSSHLSLGFLSSLC